MKRRYLREEQSPPSKRWRNSGSGGAVTPTSRGGGHLHIYWGEVFAPLPEIQRHLKLNWGHFLKLVKLHLTVV